MEYRQLPQTLRFDLRVEASSEFQVRSLELNILFFKHLVICFVFAGWGRFSGDKQLVHFANHRRRQFTAIVHTNIDGGFAVTYLLILLRELKN